MRSDEDDDLLSHIVLINEEEQHSLWREDVDIPAGWKKIFGPADKAACMKFVDENWTDMRPLSLRRAMSA